MGVCSIVVYGESLLPLNVGSAPWLGRLQGVSLIGIGRGLSIQGVRMMVPRSLEGIMGGWVLCIRHNS